MSYYYAIRITLPFACCNSIITKWADRSQKAIVYQHDADEEVSKTHVHIGLWCCEVKAEALKRMWDDVPGKGNEFWSWKEMDLDTSGKYVAYMSKGNLEPVFVKNFSQQEVDRFRQSWVEPVKADKSGDHSERVILNIVNKIKSVYRHENDGDEWVNRTETLFKLVRKETFRTLWGENRRVPHASHYKIIAGTVFMRLCEHYELFEEGISEIQNLWY